LNQTVEIKLKKTGEELNWICVFKVSITFFLLLTPRVQMNFTWTFKKEWRRKKGKGQNKRDAHSHPLSL
jgi:hypothetical protein